MSNLIISQKSEIRKFKNGIPLGKRLGKFIPRRDVLALPWGTIDSLLEYCSGERNLSLRFWIGNPPFVNPIFFYSQVGGWG